MASLEEIGEKVYYSVMIPLAFAFSASYHHFQWRVAPAAVERWAEENGFVLIKQDGAPGWGPWYSEVFNFLRFYRVLLEDESGQFHEACLKVGRRLAVRRLGKPMPRRRSMGAIVLSVAGSA